MNPAAGGGRSAKLAGSETRAPEGKRPAHGRDCVDGAGARCRNWRARLTSRGTADFSPVGGDGTAHEIINGIFSPTTARQSESSSGFLPLGTGNSFLRDFTNEWRGIFHGGLDAGRKRRVDLLRLRHATEQFIPSICSAWDSRRMLAPHQPRLQAFRPSRISCWACLCEWCS